MVDEEIVLGGYRRLHVMQTGQNSEVWQVVDAAAPGQNFAMKLLLQERTDDPAQRRMLRHEANLGMKLEHPKVIRTFKLGQEKKTLFIVMEYFPSQNLKLRLMGKQYEKFLRPRIRIILEQTAVALEYLHSQKWIHRDVKPDNILVNSSGEVRLIDFALAVRTASAFAKRFGRRGPTMGTRSYMSPEQVRGYPLDCRADVYSFGIVIHELINGRPPFSGQNSADLLRKHISEPAPRFEPERKATPEFEALVLKMMAKKEADRVQTMGDFLHRLRAIKIFTDENEKDRAENARRLG